jgi:hypothetical protein
MTETEVGCDRTMFWPECFKGRDYFGEQITDVRVMLKYTLRHRM